MLINYAKFLVCMVFAIGSALLAAQEVEASTAVSARAIPSGEISASGIDSSDYHGRFAIATSASGSTDSKTSKSIQTDSVIRAVKKATPAGVVRAVKPLPDIDALTPLPDADAPLQ